MLLSISVKGEQETFQSAHNDFAEVVDQLQEITLTIVRGYRMELADTMRKPMSIMILQNVSSNIYFLDLSGFTDPTYVRKISVGIKLLDFWKETSFWLDLENNAPPKAIDIDSLNIVAPSSTHDMPQNSDIHCHGYNLTLADSENGTVIKDVTISRCGGSTLRSFIIGKPSEFHHIKRISLDFLPITELTGQRFHVFSRTAYGSFRKYPNYAIGKWPSLQHPEHRNIVF